MGDDGVNTVAQGVRVDGRQLGFGQINGVDRSRADTPPQIRRRHPKPTLHCRPFRFVHASDTATHGQSRVAAHIAGYE